jgi:DsbC/DsbD-like thiol-disulfide interchange protein
MRLSQHSDFACRRLYTAGIAALLILLGLAQLSSGQVLDTPADRLKTKLQSKKPAKSYEISSRIHLAQGTSEGYLVVQVKLKKGCHIYSLAQSGAVPPTKLTVTPSKLFRLTGKFTPDSPAKVNPKDPNFGQRIEKHEGTIQFFAPLQVDPNADLKKIAAEVQFDGQVCTNDACIPVRRHKTKGKFAGYFAKEPAKGRNPSVATKPENPGLGQSKKQ